MRQRRRDRAEIIFDSPRDHLGERLGAALERDVHGLDSRRAKRKRSALRCTAEPTPTEAKLNVPGLAFAAATNSWMVLMPFDGADDQHIGTLPIAPTAAKSRAAS